MPPGPCHARHGSAENIDAPYIGAVGRRRWWVFVVVALLLAGLAALAVSRSVRRAHFGTVHGENDTVISAGRGDRFSLAVPDRGASVGDRWTADVEPGGVVALRTSEHISDSLLDRVFGPGLGGGAGTRYFVFEATNSGSATIRLRNCFQGCHPESPSPESRTVVWTVTVH